MWGFHNVQVIICIIVITFFVPLPVHAQNCSSNVTVIIREKEIFNKTNIDDVCFRPLEGYKDKVTTCGPYVINPKCVCAYDMYVNEIDDLCKNKPVAVGSNGSIKHQSDQFCKDFSQSKNGPCQNGGELYVKNELASDAKCICEGGFFGDFCDTIKKRIVCTRWNAQESSDHPNCSTTFIASNNRYCLLSFEFGTMYLCDSQKDATEDLEECKPAPDRVFGEDSGGSSSSSSIRDFLVLKIMTMCFFFHWILRLL